MSSFWDIITGKKWVAYGSQVGGVLGALLIHLNELLPASNQLTFGLQIGFALAVALGMIGGILGGVFGSLISGALAGEDIVLNIGKSLGIGMMNGFLTGTLTGLVLGLLRIWKPHWVTINTILLFIAVVSVVAIIAWLFKKIPQKK